MLEHRPTELEPVHVVVSVSQPNRLPQIFCHNPFGRYYTTFFFTGLLPPIV